jgi:hypothetical protein
MSVKVISNKLKEHKVGITSAQYYIFLKVLITVSLSIKLDSRIRERNR